MPSRPTWTLSQKEKNRSKKKEVGQEIKHACEQLVRKQAANLRHSWKTAWGFLVLTCCPHPEAQAFPVQPAGEDAGRREAGLSVGGERAQDPKEPWHLLSQQLALRRPYFWLREAMFTNVGPFQAPLLQ